MHTFGPPGYCFVSFLVGGSVVAMERWGLGLAHIVSPPPRCFLPHLSRYAFSECAVVAPGPSFCQIWSRKDPSRSWHLLSECLLPGPL